MGADVLFKYKMIKIKIKRYKANANLVSGHMKKRDEGGEWRL